MAMTIRTTHFSRMLAGGWALWAALAPAVWGGESWLAPIEAWVDPRPVPLALVSQVEAAQPFESPLQPFESPLQPFESPLAAGEYEAPSFRASQALREALALESPATPPSVVTQGSVAPIAPTDLGSLLQSSDEIQTLNAQRRSPVAFDPHVRGYRFGEIYTQYAGEYFLPVRLDLDSMLSRIDPYLIQSVSVIPGPYGLRFGPGFAFINVTPLDTPRSDCGLTWSNRFSILTRGNGSQVIGQDTVQGAGTNYGFIASYGHRTGADYFAGNGQRIPTSFHAQTALLQTGFDLSDDSRVEFRYNRYDMWNTEQALQFFDINSLVTDSFNLNYASEDLATATQTLGQVWYNQTRFNGDNLRASKTEIRTRVTNGLNNDFNTTLFQASDFQGFVAGQLVSTGARVVRTYGEEAGQFARVGADVRYVTQSTTERFQINDPGTFLTPDDENFFTNQPHAVLTDPGLFVEYGTPWWSFFKTTMGARIDWAHTHPRVADYDDSPLIPGVSDQNFSQNDVLLAGYLTGELELTPEWSLRGGVGYAERVPDLVNRYADGVFLGILQNGFSKVAGFPALKKARATQLDLSAIADYGRITGRASYFYTWINDYHTYVAFGVDPPTGAQILLAQNTPLATLTGFELYGDWQWTDVTSLFASLQYVEGTDQSIDRPLPQIYPLQSRLGIRWNDPGPDSAWGVEWGFRLVARQNRIGFLRDGLQSTTTIAVETPTAGFYTSYIRAYYNLTRDLHLVGGVDNLFDRTYLEHLDLRLRGPAQTPGGVTAALAPGFTAYAGLEWLL
jgi:outer membrane receptor protein involved in Fe transport